MGALNLGRVRGTMWYSGVGISGTSTTGVVFPGSGVTAAYEGDMFLNTSTGEDAGNVYRCVVEGDPQVAEWVYAGALKVQTELVNNLDSTSVTKGLAANQGRVLKEMIENSGIIPLDVLPKCNETAYNAQLVVKNEAATITVKTYDGETGTYTVTPEGTGSTKTVTFTIGSEIGLPTTGAAIREISSTVPIYTYALFDNDNQQIAGGDPDLWSRVNEAEENVQEGAAITDGTEEDPGETVKRGLLSKIINGIRTKLWPVTHAKAVWYNESEDTTVWDEFGNVREYISDHLIDMHNALPSGTSIDDVKDPGVYGITGSNTYTGLPSGITYGELLVFRDSVNSGFIAQMLVSRSQIFTRSFQNNMWIPWFGSYNAEATTTNITILNQELHRQGNIVVFDFYGTVTTEWPVGSSGNGRIKLPSGFRPTHFVPLGGAVAGTAAGFSVNSGGNFETTVKIPANTTIRIGGAFYTDNAI